MDRCRCYNGIRIDLSTLSVCLGVPAPKGAAGSEGYGKGAIFAGVSHILACGELSAGRAVVIKCYLIGVGRPADCISIRLNGVVIQVVRHLR